MIGYNSDINSRDIDSSKGRGKASNAQQGSGNGGSRIVLSCLDQIVKGAGENHAVRRIVSQDGSPSFIECGNDLSGIFGSLRLRPGAPGMIDNKFFNGIGNQNLVGFNSFQPAFQFFD